MCKLIRLPSGCPVSATVFGCCAAASHVQNKTSWVAVGSRQHAICKGGHGAQASGARAALRQAARACAWQWGRTAGRRQCGADLLAWRWRYTGKGGRRAAGSRQTVYGWGRHTSHCRPAVPSLRRRCSTAPWRLSARARPAWLPPILSAPPATLPVPSAGSVRPPPSPAPPADQRPSPGCRFNACTQRCARCSERHARGPVQAAVPQRGAGGVVNPLQGARAEAVLAAWRTAACGGRGGGGGGA